MRVKTRNGFLLLFYKKAGLLFLQKKQQKNLAHKKV